MAKSKELSVSVRPFNSSSSKTVAFVDLAVPTELGMAYYRGATLVNGSKGLFLQLPSHKSKASYAKDGYADTYFFDGPLKKAIEKQAIDAHKKQTAAEG
jgi:hypothetical protein